MELYLLPDHLEIIGERWSFYLKIAGYSYFGAAILVSGRLRWWLASLGFIVSVHNYPAAAWHTIDGIFFAVLAFWFLFRHNLGLLPGALCVVLSMLCKQSFYPLLPLFLLAAGIHRGWRGLWWGGLGLSIGALAYWGLLQHLGIWEGFVEMTTASTSSGQALERGFWDYFRINSLYWLLPFLLVPFFLPTRFLPNLNRRWAMLAFVGAITASYLLAIYQYQTFTPPVGQTRLLFLIALVYLFFDGIKSGKDIVWKKEGRRWAKGYIQPLALLGVSWMASISWGYNFPVLFATPFIFVLILMVKSQAPSLSERNAWILNASLVVLLLGTFRYAYQYVYRDGPRHTLNQELSILFPKLKHIYSDPATFEKYRELKSLRQKYGDLFKTMPSFPLSNYLTKTKSPLPLDWVFNSETNGQNGAIYEIIKKREVHFFIEKEALKTIENNYRYEVSKYILENLEQIDETNYFLVFK